MISGNEGPTIPAIDQTVAAAVRAAAQWMSAKLSEIAVGIADHIRERIPEIDQLGLGDAVLTACQTNTIALTDALIRGAPSDSLAPSIEALQITRTLVRVGLSLPLQMRAYRVGSQYWLQRWSEAVMASGDYTDAATLVGAVKEGISFQLGWLEIVTERVSEEYRLEAERIAIDRTFVRAADIRQALHADDLDVDEIGRRLGFRFRKRHVALVLRDCRDTLDSDGKMEDTLDRLGRAVGASRPLVARVDLRTTWCWLECQGSEPLHLPPPEGDIIAAQGRPAKGLDGFRRSHHEALSAMRVAMLMGRRGSTITYYDEVDIASICSVDPGLCFQFIHDELGPLATNGARIALLRTTLEAFYAANSNCRAAAVALGIHHNTVRYRLDQMEDLLGRSLGERRLALELALHLAGSIGYDSGMPGIKLPVELRP
jgi:hypothetical protein